LRSPGNTSVPPSRKLRGRTVMRVRARPFSSMMVMRSVWSLR
jgi:hypothetical protein